MNGQLKKKLDLVFRDIETNVSDDGRLTIHATKESIPTVLGLLKDEGWSFLQLISCVDWIEQDEMEIVYVLSSYIGVGDGSDTERDGVFLKARIPRSGSSLTTAIHIFANAEPYEREIHELFGVYFEGHPRLTPLFLDREYKIPPFRKDFDTEQYVKDVFDSVPQIDEES
ncbi:NADH-quinone oxidoreductase subunit C [bacterium]|nr:NADH-quinone oxidoreductase subunit C [bacterium]